MRGPLRAITFGTIGLQLVLAGCAGRGGRERPPTPETRPFEIRLASRTFTPSPGVDPAFVTLATEGADARRHGLLQLPAAPTLEDHARLRQAGIRLLGYLGGTTYVASFPTGTPLRSAPIRWAGPLLPGDKIAPDLAAGRYQSWAAIGEPPHAVKALVEFHADVNDPTAQRDLATAGLRGEKHAGTTWQVEVPLDRLPAVAALDTVKRVQQGPLPFLPLNDEARVLTNTDTAQGLIFTGPQPLYGKVSGAGARIGICDSGVDENHDDFKNINANGTVGASRLYRTALESDSHGTHVASIAAGSGFNSAANGHAAFALRGHAPRAAIGNYFMFGSYAGNFYSAISIDGTDVTNHSYVQSYTVYDAVAANLDRIVCGDGTWVGNTIAARPAVFSAGNNGTSAQYDDEEGYYAVFTSAKNTVSVGSLDSRTGRLSSFSSLGPTFDGRIKPDVVAPGCGGPGGIDAAAAGTQGYTGFCGTSMAAPVVSGIIALLFEQYRDSYGVDPDGIQPSWYKAMLVHTAKDQVKTANHPDGEFDNPDTGAPVRYHAGPDFATGYGLVDAEAARMLVADPTRWSEQALGETGDEMIWCLQLPAQSPPLKVTLAWDDAPGETLGAQTASKLLNDLDLELIDRNGNVTLPWTLNPLPVTAHPGDGARDPIAPADVVAAHRGPDHRNNVEMAVVDAPAPGLWFARIKATNLPLGTLQRFDVASSHPFLNYCVPPPGSSPFCLRNPDVCSRAMDLCERHPWICQDTGRQRWRPDQPLDPRSPVPTDEICRAVAGCPGCTGPDVYCAAWSVRMRGVPSDAVVIVIDDRGVTVAEATRGTSRVVSIPQHKAGRRHYLLVTDGAGKPYPRAFTPKFESTSVARRP